MEPISNSAINVLSQCHIQQNRDLHIKELKKIGDFSVILQKITPHDHQKLTVVISPAASPCMKVSHCLVLIYGSGTQRDIPRLASLTLKIDNGNFKNSKQDKSFIQIQ